MAAAYGSLPPQPTGRALSVWEQPQAATALLSGLRRDGSGAACQLMVRDHLRCACWTIVVEQCCRLPVPVAVLFFVFLFLFPLKLDKLIHVSDVKN